MHFKIAYITKFGTLYKEKDCFESKFLSSVLSAANLQKSWTAFVYKMRPMSDNLQFI